MATCMFLRFCTVPTRFLNCRCVATKVWSGDYKIIGTVDLKKQRHYLQDCNGTFAPVSQIKSKTLNFVSPIQPSTPQSNLHNFTFITPLPFSFCPTLFMWGTYCAEFQHFNENRISGCVDFSLQIV